MEEKNLQGKISYEELNKVAAQLQQRCVMLENKLRSLDIASMRLNFLLKILENAKVFPEQFIANCVEEVQDLMTIDQPEEDKEDRSTEEVETSEGI